MTDVTEFAVAGEKLYLSPVMDLFNREIIAFETSRRPVFKLVKSMLVKALSRLGDEEQPILHSDQGWQYQMQSWQEMLQDHKIEQSMSRKGNCLDNAAMESFFAVLKSEFFHPNHFTSIDSLDEGIAEYIHYYNNDRIKLKLKGLSPVQYRTQPLNRPTLRGQFIMRGLCQQSANPAIGGVLSFGVGVAFEPTIFLRSEPVLIT